MIRRLFSCALGAALLAACATKRLPPGTPPPEYEQRSVAPWPSAEPPASAQVPAPETVPSPAETSGTVLDAGVDVTVEPLRAPFPDAAVD